MPNPEIPSDAPPSYAQATGSSTASNNLEVPHARNNIPPRQRRSMEDEGRPVPEGWVRLYDTGNDHQYFTNTRSDPPRSIWHHPYDDEQYLSTLSSEERERIQVESMSPKYHDDGASTDGSVIDEATSPKHDPYTKTGKGPSSPLPNAAAGEGSSAQVAQPQQKPKFGRRFKDKVTGMTHDQRVAERERQAREEEEQYRQYLAFRTAMKRAMETGQPQLLGKDNDGKDIYVEPPVGYSGYGRYGGTTMGGYPGSPGRGTRYVNPYNQGIYANPNARFVRPADPYNRPYGSRYGGGYGLPIAGGLAGGLLLGGALGGFGL